MLLERKRLGVAVSKTGTREETDGDGLLVFPAETPCPAQGQFGADVLGERRVPDHSVTVFVLGHQGFEQAQGVAGKGELKGRVTI